MLSIALYITLALVVMALLMNLYRLTVGPDLPDRVLALDTMYVNSIALSYCSACGSTARLTLSQRC